MAITITALAASAACDAIVDLVDVNTPGTIEIKSAASTVAGTSEVATLTFAAAAFGAAASGVATAGTIIDDSSATGGTAGFYTVFDGNALAIWQGVVSVSGDDLDLSSLSVGALDTVSISAFTMTMPLS